MAPEIVAAKVAAAPGSDGLMVTIQAIDGGTHRHGPCAGWAPRPDGRAPQRGDNCAVIELAAGKWWVIGWDGGPLGPINPGTPFAQYHHSQAAPQATWTITHNLNRRPNVKVVDSTGTEVYGTVAFITANQLTVSFSDAFAGDAYLD